MYFFYRCKVLIVGGGSGGCAMAAKLSSKLGKNKVIVLDPADVSYKNIGYLCMYVGEN